MGTELQEAFATTAERHRNKNPMLEDAIEDAMQEAMEQGIPIVLARIPIGNRTLAPPEVKQAASRFKARGWENKTRRIDGKPTRCWVWPEQPFQGLEEEPPATTASFQYPEEPPY